jgi:hypothetical protein
VQAAPVTTTTAVAAAPLYGSAFTNWGSLGALPYTGTALNTGLYNGAFNTGYYGSNFGFPTYGFPAAAATTTTAAAATTTAAAAATTTAAAGN